MMMGSGRTNLTEKEEKDLKKFTKFFALKAIQVIVQSRSGSKIESNSKVQSDGTDWFNLAIHDDLTVKSRVRKLIAQDVPNVSQPITVEVSLETSEGDKMVLESWSLCLKGSRDPSAKVHYAVYNRMALILKSIFCVARAVPAYKISKRQAHGDYKVLSSIFVGDAKLSMLGQDFQTMQIGIVPTPVGTLSLTVSYRTNLTMSVRKLRAQPMAVSDDHYCNTPVGDKEPLCRDESDGIEIPGGAEVSASQEACGTSFSSSPSNPSHHPSASPAKHKKAEDSNKHQSDSEQSTSLSSAKQLGAFATAPPIQDQLIFVPEETPFESLLLAASQAKKEPLYAPQEEEKEVSGGVTSESLSSDKSSSSIMSEDDFVMVDLNPAFAKSDSSTDLANFYLTFQSAPDLELFTDQPSLTEVLEKQLPEQLSLFEKNSADFAELIEGLHVGQDEQSD